MVVTDDLRARLDELREQGESLQADAARLGDEVASLVRIPQPRATTVVLAPSGLLDAVDFDGAARREMTTDELLSDLHAALTRANAAAAIVPADSSALADLVAAGGVPEEMRIENDLRTLAVTAMWGTVVLVEWDVRWVEASSDRALGEELVRVGRQAALASDRLGRFEKGVG